MNPHSGFALEVKAERKKRYHVLLVYRSQSEGLSPHSPPLHQQYCCHPGLVGQESQCLAGTGPQEVVKLLCPSPSHSVSELVLVRCLHLTGESQK